MPNTARIFLGNTRRRYVIIFLLGLILVCICVACALFFYPVSMLSQPTTRRFRVDGLTMEPSLHLDDFVLVNTQAYAEQTPRRGDIVIYNAPSAPTRFFIHRVIGLPGEHISVKQGKVSINGMPLNEPYTSSIAKYEGEWDLKDNECFVLGDNRANSADSHLTGALPIKNIIGKVVLVYWPPSHWGNVPEIRYAP